MSMIHRPWILSACVLACAVLVAGYVNKDKGRSTSDTSVRVTASALRTLARRFLRMPAPPDSRREDMIRCIRPSTARCISRALI